MVDLKRLFENTKKQLNAQTNELKIVNERKKELETKYQEMNDYNSSLSVEMMEMEHECKKLKSEIEWMKNKPSNLEKEVCALKEKHRKELENLEKEKDAKIADQKRKLEEAVKEHTNSLNLANQETIEAKMKFAILENSVVSCKRQIQDLEAKNKSLKTDHENNRNKLLVLELDNARLLKQISNLQEQLREVRNASHIAPFDIHLSEIELQKALNQSLQHTLCSP